MRKLCANVPGVNTRLTVIFRRCGIGPGLIARNDEFKGAWRALGTLPARAGPAAEEKGGARKELVLAALPEQATSSSRTAALLPEAKA